MKDGSHTHGCLCCFFHFFVINRGPTGIVGDTLELNEESEEGHMTLEKYAFSNALAQSVKLAVWESMLETFVDSIVFVTEVRGEGGFLVWVFLWLYVVACVCIYKCLY